MTQHRATLFVRFNTSSKKIEESGLDIGMPPAGFLHDELIALLNGEDGVITIESVVVKECQPVPTALEVVQSICQGCQTLKETSKTTNGVLCIDCAGSVIPIGKKKREIK
jgi:hypothetical protein